MILTVLLAAAAPPAAATPPPEPSTLQQDFDAASKAAASGHCDTAIPKFEALERSGSVRQGSIPWAAITVRKGICAIRLNREDADEAAVQKGLAVLDKAETAFDGDIVDGWVALGDAAMRRYDYAGASAAFQRALERLKGETRLNVLPRLARATTFDGTPQSLAYASEGIDIVSAMPKPNKDFLAAFHTLHARALLNQGDAEQAYKEMKTALSLSGGLTNRVSLSEVSLRSDLAMAAMLVGKKDQARLYLAYTGAGRIKESPFASAVSMDPPLCGDETGLRPEDLAVVEFSIADDGTVSDAQTVYSRGGPAVAAAFGEAVSQWYWRPEDIAAVPPFYRALTRVEVRCSNVLGSGPGVMGPLRERFMTWATAHLPVPLDADTTSAAMLENLHRYLDNGANASDTAGRVAALGWLRYIEPGPKSARMAMVDQALDLAPSPSVPPEVANWFAISRLRAKLSDKRRVGSDDLRAYVALSEDPAVAADALAADTLRLLAARGWQSKTLKEAPALLNMVAQDDRLPANHPLRQLAWLDLAGKAAADGQAALAQEYFGHSGLTDEQCSLLGVTPSLKRTNVSSSDFPIDALSMGFEGWVRTELDIMTNGNTANVRPIIAYPPLIFADAATKMAKDLEYNVSFRPGSSLACSANRETIKFEIPSNR